MRVGRTAFIVFASKVLGSVLGFLATLYFARTLGAEVWGYYASVLALVAWLKLGGELGVSKAVTKRISEGDEPNAFFTSGFVLVLSLGAVLALVVLLLADFVNSYIGKQVAPFVAALLMAGLFVQLIKATLRGERRVHLSGVLEPVQITLRSLVQLALVIMAGIGLTGLLIGYVAGAVIVGCCGLVILSTGYTRPERRHFEQIFDYAKYSWFSGFRSRSFNDVDILVLTAFVSSQLVGIYAIAWSIAKFLTLFGSAISATIFPEISRSESVDNDELIVSHIEDSIRYGGLTTIPGLFGSVVVADRILAIYGEEFVMGTAVLGILILSTVFNSYLKQFLTALNGIDRPDIAFRINVVFMTLNLLLNIVLVWQFGWVGAAVATATSVVIGVLYSYKQIRTLVTFRVPLGELTRQVVAATVMAGVVFGLRRILEETSFPQHNLAIVLLLVSVGAGVYFAVLIGISKEFRTTVQANIPV
jgi:O-antigen/teichoic acid export membrane protein